MKDKTVIALIFLIIIIFASVMVFTHYRNSIYDFGNVQISKKQFNELVSTVPDGFPFTLCNMKTGECVKGVNMKDRL